MKLYNYYTKKELKQFLLGRAGKTAYVGVLVSGSDITPEKHHVSWPEWEHRATLLSKVDFGCRFVYGHCDVTETKTACCNGCLRNFGYFYFNGVQKKNINKVVNMWSNKTGFFRKGRGCILPREMRSFTCLAYVCANKKRTERASIYSEEVIKHMQGIEFLGEKLNAKKYPISD